MLSLPTDKKYFTIMSLSHIHSTSKEETLREAKPSSQENAMKLSIFSGSDRVS
jgi:hypothetical protein